MSIGDNHILWSGVMYCSKCGEKLRATDVFCFRCGNKVIHGIDCAGEMVHDNTQPRFNTIHHDQAATAINRRLLFLDMVFAVVSSLLVFLVYVIPLQVATSDYWSVLLHIDKLIINGYRIIFDKAVMSEWWFGFYEVAITFNLLVLIIPIILLCVTFHQMSQKNYSTKIYRNTIFINTGLSILYALEGLLTIVFCSKEYAPTTYAYFAPLCFALMLIIRYLTRYSLEQKTTTV